MPGRPDKSSRSGQAGLVRQVRRHAVPAWWRDAKLGIFVHWTPASVPAFAPVGVDMGALLAERRPDALAWSPYAEWYQNSLAFPQSPVAEHHRQVYGNRPYNEFARDWEAGLATWDPDDWARRFAATGARYVVLVTKHHDGYCLWPTSVRNPNVAGLFSERDVVGELAEAVRGQGMRFGVYYSGGLDWTFNDHPLGAFSDLVLAQPGGQYPAYAEAQVRELIERYRPSVLWNDISWPASTPKLARLLADYYRAVPDGVVNDRFMPRSPAWVIGGTAPARRLLDVAAARSAKADKGIVPPKPPLFDVRTPEYTTFDQIQSTPWECVRGIDASFGHNEQSDEADFLSRRDLLWSWVDIVAKGGNLLLNVGPRGVDATIAPAQVQRLDWLAEFNETAGHRLFDSRPWITPGRDRGAAAPDRDPDIDVRYLARGRDLFALLRSPQADREVRLAEVTIGPTSRVCAPDDENLTFDDDGMALRITLPEPLGPDIPTGVVLADVAARGS
jgi:alpha-L-fucosidase